MRAILRCFAIGTPAVTLRKTGIVPMGLQMVNRATPAVMSAASSMSRPPRSSEILAKGAVQ